MQVELSPAVLTAISTFSISGVVGALITYGEFREFKRNSKDKLDGVKKNLEDRAAYNFQILKDEMMAHEERDNQRQIEVIDRISRAEQNILEGVKGR